MHDEWQAAMTVVASIHQLLRERLVFAHRLGRAWQPLGFRGVAALAGTQQGRRFCEHGLLASGVRVVSIRCEHEARSALFRYLSDERMFVRPLKAPLTDIYDHVFDTHGFEGVKRLYAADILAKGASTLIVCDRRKDNDEEILALADVIGCRLVFTLYGSKSGRTRKTV